MKPGARLIGLACVRHPKSWNRICENAASNRERAFQICKITFGVAVVLYDVGLDSPLDWSDARNAGESSIESKLKGIIS